MYRQKIIVRSTSDQPYGLARSMRQNEVVTLLTANEFICVLMFLHLHSNTHANRYMSNRFQNRPDVDNAPVSADNAITNAPL